MDKEYGGPPLKCGGPFFEGVHMVKRLYPGGKAKALNFSYDDGVTQDVRLVSLLNQYDLKGTFNLNSKLLLDGFAWRHPCGKTICRLPISEAVHLYDGHEIASHTATHPMLESMTEDAVLDEMVSDHRMLRQLFNREVSGFALPFSHHDEKIYRCTKQAGFAYARISDESHDFTIPEDFYRWRGSIFHLDEETDHYVDAFIATDQELALFQLIGHSYDLDVHEKWEWFEQLLEKLKSCDDIWSATHIEIVNYLRGMAQAEISDHHIINNSDIDLYFLINGVIKILHPGEKENF